MNDTRPGVSTDGGLSFSWRCAPDAQFRKDEKELTRAYSGFLKRYDQEIKLSRPE